MEKNINILLVEDNQADIDITVETLLNFNANSKKKVNKVDVAKDGVEALAYLRKEGEYEKALLPNLIILDLNLPKKDGREVLEEIKRDSLLSQIPVVVFTSSDIDLDIKKSYKLHANAYIIKPVDLKRLRNVLEQINNFWFSTVELP